MMVPKNAKPKAALSDATSLVVAQPLDILANPAGDDSIVVATGVVIAPETAAASEAQAQPVDHSEPLISSEGSSSAGVLSSASSDTQTVERVAELEALFARTDASTSYSAALEQASETNSTDTTQGEAANGEAGDAASLAMPQWRMPPPFLSADGSARLFSSDEPLIGVVPGKNVKIDGVMLEVGRGYRVPIDIYDALVDVGAIADEDD